MTVAAPILIFHKPVRLPGTWFLASDTGKWPPSAHPFSRASAGARAPVPGQAGLLVSRVLGQVPFGVRPLGLVAQLVRARA